MLIVIGKLMFLDVTFMWQFLLDKLSLTGAILNVYMLRVATLQSCANSLTFPDILREHILIIDPLNSSDINKMHSFLAATLIYTDIYDNYIIQYTPMG